LDWHYIWHIVPLQWNLFQIWYQWIRRIWMVEINGQRSAWNFDC